MAPKKREVIKTSEERTSAKVASAAAKILRSKTASKAAKSAAASALTQRSGRKLHQDIRLDTERLDWLERQPGFALINDDAGRWVVASDGMQNVPDNKKAIDIATTFFIEAKDWRITIREAIDAAMNRED